MNPAYLRSARSIFERALELDGEERQSFVLESTRDEPELREWVEHLLAKDAELEEAERRERAERGGTGEQQPSSGRSSSRALEPFPLLEIESYRILGKIGQGGSADVYLAERKESPAGQVAIKVVRSGIEDAKARQRILDEQLILSSFEHPNVARLFEAGATRDGRPYFVLEFVRGVPIDEHCDGRNLSIEGRLELFRKVCAAVQDAHRNLIVHRDLKPANILIDPHGEPKLLDFGIAKILPRSGQVTGTRTENRVLTPRYASPEQLTGGVITTSSDIYSLGIILYELLCGAHPFGETAVDSADVQARALRPLLSPSARCSADLDSGPARGLTTDRLRRRLRGDLDTIVAKALRYEPGARYGSVAELSADVGRHLSGLPVIARSPSLSYRFSKFVRRNRWPVVNVAILVVVLIATSLVLWRQNALLLGEKARVERESSNAQAIYEFLVESFSEANPMSGGDKVVAAPEILERAVRRLSFLEADADLKAGLLRAIGSAFRGLGDYERARELLEQARDMSADAQPYLESSEQWASATIELAAVLHLQGKNETAERLAQEAVSAWTALRDPVDAEVMEARNTLAGILKVRGQIEEAEAIWRQIIQVGRENEPGSEYLAAALNNLGLSLEQRAKFEEGEVLLREAISIREARGEAEYQTTPHGNLANLLSRTGRYAEAVALQEEILEERRRVLGADHPKTLGALSNLAVLRFFMGNYEAAEQPFRAVLAARRKQFGDDHPAVASSLGNLAMLLKRLGRLEEAESPAREALAIKMRLYESPHLGIALARNNLAILLTGQGEHEEAEALLSAAVEEYRAALPGEDTTGSANALANLARVWSLQGRSDQAEEGYREAVEIRARLLGADHLDVVRTELALAELLSDSERPEEAAELAEVAIPRMVAELPEGDLEVASAVMLLGRIRSQMGEEDEAEELLLRGLESIERGAAPGSGAHRKALARVVEFYAHVGRTRDAEAYRRRMLDAEEKTSSDDASLASET